MEIARPFLLAVGLLACAACAHADDTAEPLTPPIQPALFVARDADSTMYLYGTVHVRRRGAAWGGPDAQAALAQSDEIWTEMEMSAEADARAAQAVMVLGAAPEGRPLSSWLNDDERARLAALSLRLGIAPASLETMQPWLAALRLSLAPMQLAGYDPMSGVDRAINARGVAKGATMRAFENEREQLQFLSGLSDEAQREMLLEAIDDSEDGPAQLDVLTSAWERGDTDEIERVVIDEMRTEYPELYDVLFRRRNAEWVAVLSQELEGAGTDFVAVGTGHLLGDDGLVAQLRARGVSVERVGAELTAP